MDILQQKMTLI